MSVGGKIIAVKQRKDRSTLLVKDNNDYTIVDAAKNDFKRGDKIWWQSGKHYWTRPTDGTDKYEFVERVVDKIGYSKPWSG